jgi:LAGLIDADG DNA endonuclease family protein
LYLKQLEIKKVSYIFYRDKYFLPKATGPFGKKYSTHSNSLQKLNPYWVTGFSVGEACFSIDISKVKDHNLGWKITPNFSIGLHSKDLALIKEIQSFFNGAGKIYSLNNSTSMQDQYWSCIEEVVFFRIKSVKDLAQYVIPHFYKYPLLFFLSPPHYVVARR